MKIMFIFSVSDKGDSEKMNLKSEVGSSEKSASLSFTQQISHNHWFQFPLGITVVPRKIEDDGYANFLGGKQGVLYMVYTKMVTETLWWAPPGVWG